MEIRRGFGMFDAIQIDVGKTDRPSGLRNRLKLESKLCQLKIVNVHAYFYSTFRLQVSTQTSKDTGRIVSAGKLPILIQG
ncbi:unnamed protein product [Allacma fusca]|uniref:Uncharacterized protein n=1 Tax=Allacma fusca TaxID=39272 RepID=A0A8J2KYW5_9HEXA|nr:unnamed protein product [Allacma fusca]